MKAGMSVPFRNSYLSEVIVNTTSLTMAVQPIKIKGDLTSNDSSTHPMN